MTVVARDSEPEFQVDLYRSYLNALGRALLSSGPLRNKLDASDLVQETLIKAHQGRDQFRGNTRAEFLTWLRRILEREFIDQQRQNVGVGREHAPLVLVRMRVAEVMRTEREHTALSHLLHEQRAQGEGGGRARGRQGEEGPRRMA